MKKKIIIGLIVTLIVVVVAFFPNKKTEEQLTKKETIEQISKGFGNGISKKELEKLMNQKIEGKTMMTGKEAYLLKTPNDELIKKYNLDNYVKQNKTYFNKLETKIKENYSWEFEGEVQENQDAYFMLVKVYNYGIYLSDLETLQNKLLENKSAKEEKEVNEYKAKVIAMKLLDSHLDDYLNNGEAKNIAITCANLNSDETKNSLMQYLIDLAGYTNEKDETIANMVQNRDSRMQNLIDEAIRNNVLEENDLLKL